MGRKSRAKNLIYEDGTIKTRRQKYYERVDKIIQWDYWKEAVLEFDTLRLFPEEEIETLLRMMFLIAQYDIDYEELEFIIMDCIPIGWFMRLETLKSLPDEAELKGFIHFMYDTELADKFYDDVAARADEANLELRDSIWLPPKITERREDENSEGA